MDVIDILHVSLTPENVINNSTPISRLLENDHHKNVDKDNTDNKDKDENNSDKDENNNFVPFLPIHFSEYSTQIIAYIAGFVVRHLKKKVKL